MPPLRFGFLGAGQIAYPSAASIRNHPDARLAAAFDLNAERLRALCEECKIPTAHASAEALLADPEIDAVYIAVPNSAHAPLAIAALEAGKHVILEKPFAMNFEQASHAAEAARRAGRVLTLGMNQRFGRAPQRIKTLVEEGALGDIYHAKAYWMRRTGIPKLGTWFGNRALSGGGCLCDIGVHVLDLCLYLMGNFDVVSVSGATYTKFGHLGLGEGGWGRSERSEIPFDVDDFASGFLRFSNGASLTLDAAWACHQEQPNQWDVELFGDKAGASGVEGKLFAPAAEGGYRVWQDPDVPLRFPHQDRFHNFINHLLGREALCVSLEEALTVQRILDALAASSASGCEVRL